MPVRLINDARAFALAEARVGAGKGCASLVGVTLGTGVGGGIVLDGRLVLGYHGTAGEIGHQVIDCTPGAPRCGCGNTGCLEAFVRAAALASAAGTATAAEAFAADERGDPRAHAAVEQWIDHLAIGLANLVTVLTPERIVLGGGVATAAARILEPLRDRLGHHVHLTDPNRVEIVHAALGVRAGAIGAALRGLDGLARRPTLRSLSDREGRSASGIGSARVRRAGRASSRTGRSSRPGRARSSSTCARPRSTGATCA